MMRTLSVNRSTSQTNLFYILFNKSYINGYTFPSEWKSVLIKVLFSQTFNVNHVVNCFLPPNICSRSSMYTVASPDAITNNFDDIYI